MYTSYNDTPTADPSAPASAAPNTPAMSHKTTSHKVSDAHHHGSLAPLPPRSVGGPTSSPAVAAQQQPGPAGIHDMTDLHLSGSEPRIYPGMITRRQRTNSLRKSSTHEGDERVAARRVVDAVDEAEETVGEE